jgi:hypothetical protein
MLSHLRRQPQYARDYARLSACGPVGWSRSRLRPTICSWISLGDHLPTESSSDKILGEPSIRSCAHGDLQTGSSLPPPATHRKNAPGGHSFMSAKGHGVRKRYSVQVPTDFLETAKEAAHRPKWDCFPSVAMPPSACWQKRNSRGSPIELYCLSKEAIGTAACRRIHQGDECQQRRNHKAGKPAP